MELPIVQPGADRSPPVFNRIGIVGLGLIGGSIALACREVWPSSLVIAVDNKDVLETAMRLHAIDVAADDPIVLAEADIVILAAPVRQNIAMLAALEENVRQPAIVTDTGSTKRQMVEAASALPARLRFVGGHPIAGAARGGLEHARPDLFRGRPWMFTPAGDGSGEVVERLSSFVAALGATPQVLGPDAHDRLFAALSHLPQLVASALMASVGDAVGKDGLALAGRGLVDTTRLASSPAGIWRDIAATNRDFLAAALDDFIDRLRAVREDLGDGERIEALFDGARRWRDVLTRQERGASAGPEPSRGAEGRQS